jgi:hypothetical protein
LVRLTLTRSGTDSRAKKGTNMKAIRTRYLGATNVKGSRIKADDGDGNSLTIPYPHELSGDRVHYEAAKLLCNKMNWSNDLVGGGYKNDYYWCFKKQLA